MVNCTVSFGNNGVFQSGQEVTGSVEIYNEKQRTILAIVLNISGFCSTYWTESSGFGDDKTSTTYSAREDYIKTSLILTGNGRGNIRWKINYICSFHRSILQTNKNFQPVITPSTSSLLFHKQSHRVCTTLTEKFYIKLA